MVCLADFRHGSTTFVASNGESIEFNALNILVNGQEVSEPEVVDSSSLTIGKRLVVNTFPSSISNVGGSSQFVSRPPFVEEYGRKVRQITFQFVFQGNDHLDQTDKAIVLFETPGQGFLKHGTRHSGSGIPVYFVSATFQDSVSTIGVTNVSATFIEAGVYSAPSNDASYNAEIGTINSLKQELVESQNETFSRLEMELRNNPDLQNQQTIIDFIRNGSGSESEKERLIYEVVANGSRGIDYQLAFLKRELRSENAAIDQAINQGLDAIIPLLENISDTIINENLDPDNPQTVQDSRNLKILTLASAAADRILQDSENLTRQEILDQRDLLVSTLNSVITTIDQTTDSGIETAIRVGRLQTEILSKSGQILPNAPQEIYRVSPVPIPEVKLFNYGISGIEAESNAIDPMFATEAYTTTRTDGTATEAIRRAIEEAQARDYDNPFVPFSRPVGDVREFETGGTLDYLSRIFDSSRRPVDASPLPGYRRPDWNYEDVPIPDNGSF